MITDKKSKKNKEQSLKIFQKNFKNKIEPKLKKEEIIIYKYISFKEYVLGTVKYFTNKIVFYSLLILIETLFFYLVFISNVGIIITLIIILHLIGFSIFLIYYFLNIENKKTSEFISIFVSFISYNKVIFSKNGIFFNKKFVNYKDDFLEKVIKDNFQVFNEILLNDNKNLADSYQSKNNDYLKSTGWLFTIILVILVIILYILSKHNFFSKQDILIRVLTIIFYIVSIIYILKSISLLLCRKFYKLHVSKLSCILFVLIDKITLAYRKILKIKNPIIFILLFPFILIGFILIPIFIILNELKWFLILIIIGFLLTVIYPLVFLINIGISIINKDYNEGLDFLKILNLSSGISIIYLYFNDNSIYIQYNLILYIISIIMITLSFYNVGNFKSKILQYINILITSPIILATGILYLKQLIFPSINEKVYYSLLNFGKNIENIKKLNQEVIKKLDNFLNGEISSVSKIIDKNFKKINYFIGINKKLIDNQLIPLIESSKILRENIDINNLKKNNKARIKDVIGKLIQILNDYIFKISEQIKNIENIEKSENHYKNYLGLKKNELYLLNKNLINQKNKLSKIEKLLTINHL